MSRVGLARQANVKSICAFGKVAAKLIMAEVCLNRSLNRRSSRLNRDFDRPRAKSEQFRPNLWILSGPIYYRPRARKTSIESVRPCVVMWSVSGGKKTKLGTLSGTGCMVAALREESCAEHGVKQPPKRLKTPTAMAGRDLQENRRQGLQDCRGAGSPHPRQAVLQ